MERQQMILISFKNHGKSINLVLEKLDRIIGSVLKPYMSSLRVPKLGSYRLETFNIISTQFLKCNAKINYC